MPRLKPPPTKQELEPPALVDKTEPVGDIEIVLPDDGAGPTEIDLTAAPPATSEPRPVPKKTEPDDNPLARALADQQRAEELQRTAQRERDEALGRERDLTAERDRERVDREDAQYNSVLTAIAAEQSAIAKAESDLASFSAAGDWTNAAAAQRIMASASARLDRLEDGKQAFETRRESAKTTSPVRPTAPQPQSFEEKISALPEPARNWLRTHPEFINDTGMNDKINATHQYLTKTKGVSQFSPAYFDALDQEFGFKAAPQAATAQPQRRTMPMSAPVSRDVPSATGTRPATMTLSEEERKIARISILDRPDMPNLTNEQKEYLYAQNKRKLHAARANGSYRHTTEQTG